MKLPQRVKPETAATIAPPEVSAYQKYYADKPVAKPFSASAGVPDLESYATPDIATRPLNRAMERIKNPPPTPEGNETVAKPSRTMVLSPTEAMSEAQMQKLATRRASERGMQFAGGMVPREGRKVTQSPTRIASPEYPQPRETVNLDDLLKRRKMIEEGNAQ